MATEPGQPPQRKLPVISAKNPLIPKSVFGVSCVIVVFLNSNFAGNIPAGLAIWIFCVTAKLAVELDGGGHGFPGQRARDEKRNHFLGNKAIKVLRFWNHQLRAELEPLRFGIWHELMARTGKTDKIDGFLPKRD